MGIFDKWKAGPGSVSASKGGGVYIIPGRYTAKIVSCKKDKGQVDMVEYFLVELDVTESNNPAQPVGTRVSWMMKESWLPAASNIASFIAVASQEPVETIDEAGLLHIVSAENPLAGTLITYSASNILTKGKQSDFTKVTWISSILPPSEAATAPAPAAA